MAEVEAGGLIDDSLFTNSDSGISQSIQTSTSSRPSTSESDLATESADDETSSTISSTYTDADEHWAAQVHEITLLLNLIFLPLAGKYFGRQFAFWGWTKFMRWRNMVVVTDKKAQRISSAVLAGIS